jgi:hypothetical protein
MAALDNKALAAAVVLASALSMPAVGEDVAVEEVAAAPAETTSIEAVPAEPAQTRIPDAIQSLYSASYALVVGNDEYTAGWPRLTNAVKDAEAMAVVLEERGFEVETHLNLTSDQISDVFRRFFILKGSDREARLFIWYAGHGATVDGEGYLVPGDAPLHTQNPAEFKLSALALRDFGTYMRQAVSKHVYAVFDSCFAGTVFSSQRSAPSASIQAAATQKVRQFLTSGDAYQEVSDDGTFRELFIRAIMGEERSDSNGDGFLTATELGMFLGDRLTNLTDSMQTPRYGKLRDKNYDRGDFVFALPGAILASLPAPLHTVPSAQPFAQPSAELAFWDSIKSSKDREAFEAYLNQYPRGSFVSLARINIKNLKVPATPKRIVRAPIEIASVDIDLQAESLANVRAWPSASARKVGRLEAGTQIWAIGQADVGGENWYRVARNGVELGYVYGDLLTVVAGDIEPLTTVATIEPEPEPVVEEKPESIEDRLSNALDRMIDN